MFALLLLGLACLGSWWQLSGAQLRQNTYGLGWFVNPLEVNAALRLPAIPAALTAVEMIGDRGWAVGLGGAIVSSDDGGKTWKPSAHIVEANLRSVRFQPNGELGWAVGDGGTVLRTTDGGAHWQDVSPRPELGYLSDLVDLERNESTDELWAIGRNGTLLMSRDNAQSWRSLVLPSRGVTAAHNLSSIFFSQDGKYGWISAEGAVLVTNNGGREWLLVNVHAADGPVPQLNAVWFSGPQGWAVGENGLIVSSTDWGESWSAPHNTGTTSTLNSVIGSAEGIWASGEQGTLLFSTDGVNWVAIESGTQANLNSLALFGQARLDAALTQGGGGALTKRRARQVCQLDANSDGVIRDLPGGPDAQSSGQSPVQLPSRVPTQVPADVMPPLPWVEPIAEGREALTGYTHGIAVGDAGTIVHGPNRASPWAAVATATDTLLRSVEVSNAGNEVYAFAASGLILASNDAGRSWSASMPAGGVRWNGSSLVEKGSTWVVGDQGMMLSKAQAGSTWTTHADLPKADWQDIDFDLQGQVGIAVGSASSTLVTSDGGDTWHAGRQLLSKSDSPATRDTFRSVYVHSDGRRAWAVGDRGLLASSTNGGEHWLLTTQLPSPAEKTVGKEVRSFATNLKAIYFAKDGSTGWLTGDNGLIAKTVDGGATWRIQFHLEGVSLNSLHVTSDGKRGWVTGNGGVLLSTTNGGDSWERATTNVGSTRLAIAMAANAQTGWVVGYPPALLHTRDKGESWQTEAWPLRYWQFPAPWFWILVALAALLIWMMFRPDPPPQEKKAAAIAITDAPTADAEQDKLGFAPLARGISRFLRNTRTEPPLTVAISGGWGSGKSSLMAMICQDLRRYNYRPIWFNAWHHQNEEQLLASLLNSIRDQGLPSLLSLDGLAFRMRLLYIRSRSNLLLAALLIGATAFLTGYVIFHSNDEWNTLLTVLEALLKQEENPEAISDAEIGSLLGQLATGVVIWKSLSTALKAYGVDPAVLLSNTASRFRINEAQAQSSFRSVFAQEFADVTEALPYRTVIVIDDLDRCQPETILTVLEAVNFLVTSGNCFVIFGMETRYIRAALGLHFEHFAEELALHDPAAAALSEDERRWIYAGKYLEKLVNVEIKVPNPKDQSRLVQSSERNETAATHMALKMLQRWPLFVLILVAVLCAAAGKMVTYSPSKPALTAAADTGAALNPTATPVPNPRTAATSPAATSATDAVVLSPAPTVTQPSVPLPALTVQAASTSVLGISSIFAVVLVFAVYVAGVMLYRIRTDIRQVNDSGAFKEALHAWLPLVSQRHITPRAIKRFINRIRYLAMLQQGEQLDHSLLDELKLRHTPAPQATPSQAIAEHLLVALGVLHDVYQDDWRQRIESKSYSPEIASAIERYKNNRDVDWPPKPEELDAFESSLMGFRVAG
ncbi:YCF48-related protein [Pseudomonas sp. J452]|uniref:YCF48-related protein n=1 Tax=Pseudomonas sp. J452 TaxID=2898441 RepID=UPI0021AE1193|nr:YCF48-related protein [Pseudomonas sp. J452]UUY07311.1 YCF48-related protein [Pseudomonas sp. J452]